MKSILCDLLVDPVDLQSLSLKEADNQSEINSGWLQGANSRRYPIVNGIPRLLTDIDEKQSQTSDTFGFKWNKRESYETPEFYSVYSNWVVQKYGFDSPLKQVEYFTSRERILDLGCGSGSASLPWLSAPQWTGSTMWVGLDISAAIDVAKDRLQQYPNTHFVQGDALQLPFGDGAFDTIFSEGVLHHTPSTQAAIKSASRTLEVGGHLHFYVYRRKSPIREFTDDYVREAIQELTDEEAWHEMRSLTELGRSLAELDVKVDVPDVPVLGITAGRYDVQRLIYWNFAKLFWNPLLSFESNVHINFDWYRPQYAHRQSEVEIRLWCTEAGLRIRRFDEQESGFTVHAIKE